MIQCVLCSSGQENIQHLFFQCPYSAYIWTLCRLKLGIPCSIETLQDEANLIQEKFKKKYKSSILAKLTLAAAVWHIWKERNQRNFQLQENHKIMVFRRLYEDINELGRTCTWKSDKHGDKVTVLSNWGVSAI